MKKPLLLLSLLTLAGAARAQISPAVLNGLGLAGRLAAQRSTPQQKPTLFVTSATIGPHTFVQKRTPTKKLPKPNQGGTEIAAIEQLLAARFAILQADSTSMLFEVAQEKEFSRLRTNLEAFNAFWNTDPYSEEMSFYRQHDDIRRRLARQPVAH